MRRFLSKIPLYFTLAVISLILIISFLLNHFLYSSKGRIEEILSRYCNQRVAIESAYYLPPNYIILDNLVIFKGQDSKSGELLSVDKAEISFSLRNFITKRNFTLTNIYLNKPVIKVIGYDHLSKEGTDKFIGVVNALGKDRTLSIEIRGASFALPQKGEPENYIVVDSNLNINPDQSISGKGSIEVRDLSKEEGLMAGSLKYDFQGRFVKNGIIIDSLELKRKNLSLRIWGALDRNLLRLSGNLFSSKPAGTYYLRKPLDFINHIKKLFKYRGKHASQFFSPDISSLNIFDLGCFIKFVPKGFQLENLSFSLGETPFALAGSVMFADYPEVNLKFSSFLNQPFIERSKNPKSFDVNVQGFLKEGRFNGETQLDFIMATRPKEPRQKIITYFEDLGFYFKDKQQLNMFFQKANFYYITKDNSIDILFRDLEASVDFAGKESKFVNFNSMVYDGFLEGKGKINISETPPKTDFELNIEDVSANKLSSVLVYLSRVYGKFSSKIYYSNYPDTSLRGTLLIKDGYLNDLRFFGWLADFFKMPSLKKVDFDEISASFVLNNKVYGLEDIILDSPDVNLKGYFNLYATDLVSGKLSLAFSDSLLNTSPKFSKLLRILEEDISSVNFNFQMSGLYENMNFKWLESDFKTGLQKLLPSGIERKLEKQIEEAVETISSEK